jgi:DNA adenine methylase
MMKQQQQDYEPLRPFFCRVGGKTRLAKTIVKMMPAESTITTYVEPFVGAGSVFLRRPPAAINVINDLDGDIYDLFCDIPLVKSLNDLDFTSDEDTFYRLKALDTKVPLQRLYRNLYLSRHSYNGTRHKYGLKVRKDNYKLLKKNFQKYQEKLENTIILNQDFRKVVADYDGDDTFFYLDPPYSQQCKEWGYEFGADITPAMLLEVLLSIKGKFIMSYDLSDDNVALFQKHFRIEVVETKYQARGQLVKKEILIMNY